MHKIDVQMKGINVVLDANALTKAYPKTKRDILPADRLPHGNKLFKKMLPLIMQKKCPICKVRMKEFREGRGYECKKCGSAVWSLKKQKWTRDTPMGFDVIL